MVLLRTSIPLLLLLCLSVSAVYFTPGYVLCTHIVIDFNSALVKHTLLLLVVMLEKSPALSLRRTLDGLAALSVESKACATNIEFLTVKGLAFINFMS